MQKSVHPQSMSTKLMFKNVHLISEIRQVIPLFKTARKSSPHGETHPQGYQSDFSRPLQMKLTPYPLGRWGGGISILDRPPQRDFSSKNPESSKPARFCLVIWFSLASLAKSFNHPIFSPTLWREGGYERRASIFEYIHAQKRIVFYAIPCCVRILVHECQSLDAS